jgi:hypothetical protein
MGRGKQCSGKLRLTNGHEWTSRFAAAQVSTVNSKVSVNGVLSFGVVLDLSAEGQESGEGSEDSFQALCSSRRSKRDKDENKTYCSSTDHISERINTK